MPDASSALSGARDLEPEDIQHVSPQENLWDVTDDQHMIVYWFCDTVDRYGETKPALVADQAVTVLPYLRKFLAERVRIRRAMGSGHVR